MLSMSVISDAVVLSMEQAVVQEVSCALRMSFFGAVIRPGEPPFIYSPPPDLSVVLHITQATLGAPTPAKGRRAVLKCKRLDDEMGLEYGLEEARGGKEEEEIFVCALVGGHQVRGEREIELDWIGLDWIGLDRIGSGGICFNRSWPSPL